MKQAEKCHRAQGAPVPAALVETSDQAAASASGAGRALTKAFQQGTGPGEVRVVIVEDNPLLLEEMVFQQTASGLAVRGARDASALDQLLREAPCDVLVLDLNLPGESGFSIANRLRDPNHLGIVILSARSAIGDKVDALACGGDQYLVKPVDRRELTATIMALHRRLQASRSQSGWRFELTARALRAPDGRTLELTPQQATVFSLLVRNAGAVLDRQQMVSGLGIEYVDFPDTRLNTLISRLRQQLEAFDATLQVRTWRARGYAWIGPRIGGLSH
jgi:DNA-binding response OmpR family regulator